ncbi:MAG: hypothetical protein Ct9H300mP28_20290 [Pseudomonadota bacterium]|nr:MAG: hypothetical protein Ct9H300mP28_20290 [Pseudomonadota bacterium]
MNDSPGNWGERFIAGKPDDPDIVYIGAVGSSPGGEGALHTIIIDQALRLSTLA